MLDSEYQEWWADFNKPGGAVTKVARDPRIDNVPLTDAGWTTSLPEPAVPEPTSEDAEEGLSVKQTHAVRCIVEGMSQQKTSEVVGVTRRTICEWVKLPAFKKVVRRYRKDGLAASMNVLQAASLELAANLVRLAKTSFDPADQIRATVQALKMAQEQAFNEDIADRLDAIELSRNAGPTNGSTFSVVKRNADESQ